MNEFIDSIIGENYFLVPIIIFLLGVLNIILVYIKTSKWIKVHAVVEEVDKSRSSSRGSREVLVLSFNDEEGVQRYARLQTGGKAKNRWKENGIEILYRPDNPEKVRGVEFGLRYRWTLVLWFMATIITIAILLIEFDVV